MKIMISVMIFCLTLLPRLAFCTDSQVCFTPGSNCAVFIMTEMVKANKELLMQAYSFTDKDIEETLLYVARNNIDVTLILDKSQCTKKNPGFCKELSENGVKVYIDGSVSIAHNKVIIIDRNTVLTGSFNYTVAANKRNAENVIELRDENVAAEYVANFMNRKDHSNLFTD